MNWKKQWLIRRWCFNAPVFKLEWAFSVSNQAAVVQRDDGWRRETQPGAVKLVLWCDRMHLNFMQTVTPESQFHCTRLSVCIVRACGYRISTSSIHLISIVDFSLGLSDYTLMGKSVLHGQQNFSFSSHKSGQQKQKKKKTRNSPSHDRDSQTKWKTHCMWLCGDTTIKRTFRWWCINLTVMTKHSRKFLLQSPKVCD